MISERAFTEQVREVATMLGWLRYHTWLSRHSAAGFPDEVLVRPPRLVFAELKSEKGKLLASQEAWLDALADCGCEVYLWRPSHFDALGHVLGAATRPDASPENGAWRGSAEAPWL